MKTRFHTFKNLYCFEWIKQFKKTSIWVAIFIFSIINLIQINSVFQTNSLLSSTFTDEKWSGAYWDLYDDFKGEITNEKINRLMDIYRPLEMKTADLTASTKSDAQDTYTENYYSDRLFFSWCFVKPMEYAYRYGAYAKDIVQTATKNVGFFKSLENKYEAIKNEEIAKTFKNRKIDKFFYIEPYQYLMKYNYSVIFVLLIILYSLSGVFVSEKESGMALLLPTTKCGGGLTVLAKLLSSSSFVCLVSIWFTMLDIFGFFISFGALEGLQNPLYTVQSFANTGLNCSILEYILISLLLRLLGALVISLLFLSLSCLCKNTLLPFLIGTVGALGLLFLYFFSSGSSHIWLRIINPASLLYGSDLFYKAEYINFIGIPVPFYWSAIMLALICIAVITFLLFYTHRKSGKHKEGGKHCETVFN